MRPLTRGAFFFPTIALRSIVRLKNFNVFDVASPLRWTRPNSYSERDGASNFRNPRGFEISSPTHAADAKICPWALPFVAHYRRDPGGMRRWWVSGHLSHIQCRQVLPWAAVNMRRDKHNSAGQGNTYGIELNNNELRTHHRGIPKGIAVMVGYLWQCPRAYPYAAVDSAAASN